MKPYKNGKSSLNCGIMIRQIKMTTGETLAETTIPFINGSELIDAFAPFSEGSLVSGTLKIKAVSKSDMDWFVLFKTGIKVEETADVGGVNNLSIGHHFTHNEDHIIRVHQEKIIGSVHLRTTEKGLTPYQSDFSSDGKLLLEYSGETTYLDRQIKKEKGLLKKDNIWSINWINPSELTTHTSRDINISAIFRNKYMGTFYIYKANAGDEIDQILFGERAYKTKSYKIGTIAWK